MQLAPPAGTNCTSFSILNMRQIFSVKIESAKHDTSAKKTSCAVVHREFRKQESAQMGHAFADECRSVTPSPHFLLHRQEVFTDIISPVERDILEVLLQQTIFKVIEETDSGVAGRGRRVTLVLGPEHGAHETLSELGERLCGALHRGVF